MDNIVYINLNRRTDRKEQITNELNNFNLTHERFEAIHEEQGILGCTKSHLEVLKLAKRNGWKSVLILEDDFTFLVSKEQFEFEIRQLNESGINYDVCMLAYNLMRCDNISGCDFLLNVIEAQTASAYIIKEHYYDVLIELYEKNIPLLAATYHDHKYANDQCWKSLQRKDNWVCTKTRIGKQRAGYSDNWRHYVDYNC
jgi:glycosyl transferase family 25